MLQPIYDDIGDCLWHCVCHKWISLCSSRPSLAALPAAPLAAAAGWRPSALPEG